jgi:hypothetical protein
MSALSVVRFRRGVMPLLVIWVLASIWLGSDSGISVPGLLIVVGGAGLLLVVWLILLVVALKRKDRMKLPWVEPAVTILVLLAIYSGALFHLRFLASRRSLDRYVAQTLAGRESHRKPTNVGLFVARETEVLPNGVVRIITASCMFDECGIAFSRMQPPVVGEDRYDHLTGKWWRWWRSW